MANTSLPDFVSALESVLDFADGTGSVNFYMGGLLPQRSLTCTSLQTASAV